MACFDESGTELRRDPGVVLARESSGVQWLLSPWLGTPTIYILSSFTTCSPSLAYLVLRRRKPAKLRGPFAAKFFSIMSRTDPLKHELRLLHQDLERNYRPVFKRDICLEDGGASLPIPLFQQGGRYLQKCLLHRIVCMLEYDYWKPERKYVDFEKMREDIANHARRYSMNGRKLRNLPWRQSMNSIVRRSSSLYPQSRTVLSC